MNARTAGIFVAIGCLIIGSNASALAEGTTTFDFQPGMAAAQDPKNQATAASIFCYCGCDREHSHQSLKDCYTTGHVPSCKTCAQEFVRVEQLNSQGAGLAQIQNNIDSEFSARYPFPKRSDILKKYLARKASPGMM